MPRGEEGKTTSSTLLNPTISECQTCEYHRLVCNPFHLYLASYSTMSRSHSYSSNYSRESRQHQPPSLAVTEASFQSLQLSDTSLQPSYSTSNQYPSRGSYGQSGLSTNYLTPGYDVVTYASSSPSGSYLGSQRAVSPFASLGQDPGNLFDTDPLSYNKPDMR
ncbi:MAG: hypothetical protein L6R40_007645 [Gallowayella cf. fulva]|nr:MAG: hypothetical protein L6R40_007645 [Xanthomendoza cf. fulva]